MKTKKLPKSKVKLHIGLLWYEQDEAAREDPLLMLANAAGRYYAKFGTVPDYCHVNPGTFGDKKIMQTGGGMKIRLDKTIQPNHVWLGVIQ